jgi:hypothetical protein
VKRAGVNPPLLEKGQGSYGAGEPEKLIILAPRSEDFRNLRTRFYLLLCSLTPQQAAGDARAIVFIDKLSGYLIND